MPNVEVKCAFCGAGEGQAREFVAGPQIFICDQCLGAAANALATRQPASTAQSGYRSSRGTWVSTVRSVGSLRRKLSVCSIVGPDAFVTSAFESVSK